MLLKLSLVEFAVIERTEFVRQSAESPDELEVRPDDIDHEADPGSLRKLEDLLLLPLAPRQGNRPQIEYS